MTMKTNSFTQPKNDLIGATRTATPCVFSSTVQIARNLANVPFPHWAKDSQRNDALALCKRAIQSLPLLEDVPFYDVSELSEAERKYLVEAHFITQNPAQTKPGTGLFLCEKHNIAIAINDDDHLSLQILKKGFNVLPSWRKIDAIDSQLERFLDFAFSAEFGYLSPSIANVGTGLHASVTVHLPGLAMANQTEALIATVKQLQGDIIGAFGDAVRAPGGFFRVTNLQTLGDPEATILKRFSNTIKTIVEKELDARKTLLETKRAKLFDKIGRAYGILKNSHSLSLDETIHFLSFIRLASELKLLPATTLQKIDNLILRVQPAHLVLENPQLASENDSHDAFRASLLRQELTAIPMPNFHS